MAWSKHFDASGDVNHVESGYDEEEKEKNVHAHNHDCGDIIGIIAKQFRREKSRNGKRNGKQIIGTFFLWLINEPTSFLRTIRFKIAMSKKQVPVESAIAYTPMYFGINSTHGIIATAPTIVLRSVFCSLPSEFSIGVVACAVAIGKSINEQ